MGSNVTPWRSRCSLMPEITLTPSLAGRFSSHPMGMIGVPVAPLIYLPPRSGWRVLGGGCEACRVNVVSVPPATLDAVLERITYANEESGYTVARVATGRSADLVTVVGPLLGAQPGESLRLRGRWRSHPHSGRSSKSRATRRCCQPLSRGSAATSARG